MTKADLVERIAKDAKMSKRAAEAALDSVLDGIRDSLKQGKKVTLVGFGSFSVGRRKAKMRRVPTGARAVGVPSAKVVKFRSAGQLKTEPADALLGKLAKIYLP